MASKVEQFQSNYFLRASLRRRMQTKGKGLTDDSFPILVELQDVGLGLTQCSVLRRRRPLTFHPLPSSYATPLLVKPALFPCQIKPLLLSNPDSFHCRPHPILFSTPPPFSWTHQIQTHTAMCRKQFFGCEESVDITRLLCFVSLHYFPRWLAFLYCCSKLPSGEGEVVSRWPQIPSMGETTPKLALNSFVKNLLYTFHEKA